MTPDVDALVAASRADHPHHGVVFDWLDMALDASAASASFKVVPGVLAGFLRLVASPRSSVTPPRTPTRWLSSTRY